MLKFLALAFVLLPAAVHAAETERVATIVLSAEGTAAAEPDMADLTFTVEKRANTAAGALSASSEVMAKAQNALKEIGVEDRDVQTARFSVEPVIVYPDRAKPVPDAQDLAPIVVGYRVSNGIDVRLRDLGKLGTLLDRMVSLGVNSIGSIQFTNVDLDPIREEARRDAVAKAMRRAKVLTSAAGVKLGRVLSIREGDVSMPSPVRSFQARSREASPVPIAPGENEATISVTMEWAIEQ